MENKPRPGSGGMEGDGAYNPHAKFQADGGNLAAVAGQAGLTIFRRKLIPARRNGLIMVSP